MSTSSTGPRIPRLAIEHRLPIIMGGLLLAAIAALAIASYMEVRRTAIRTASERVTSVGLQFRNLFRDQAIQIGALALAPARQPAVVAFARQPNDRTRPRALAAMADAGPQPAAVIGTEIRDSTGTVLLTDIPSGFALGATPLADIVHGADPTDSTWLGRFRELPNVRDTMAFPSVAVIPGTGSYFVRWRRLGVSRRSREQITELIGSHASLFLGNSGAPGWTDLERIVADPGLRATGDSTARVYTRDPDRRQLLGSALAVPGTPWTVVIDVPVTDVFAPVQAFGRRISLLAALALLLGLVMAWFASRRITGPMRQLAERTSELDAALTQLRETQDALVKRERLALLGQLSSGVGHELRNPLGVMTNAVYYLRAVLTSSPKNVHEYLDILQQQITLSEKIVSDLLDFARQKPPQRKPTPLLEATETQLHKLGRTDGVRVEVQVPPDLTPVLVDPIQLGQIILNLLSNASQAMDGSGRILIRAEENGGNVHYDVADTGPGIKPEHMSRMFEPLFTTKARGIGLGMAVSRTLARANGGDLTVTSTYGQGATFRLTLQKAGGHA